MMMRCAAVVSTVYRNTILSKTSTIPGYVVAKLAEDKKFKADEKSSEPVSSKHGGDHVFVTLFPLPCMEDGGTLGAHALALLKMLAEYAVAQGCYSSLDSRSPLTPPMQVSLWMQRSSAFLPGFTSAFPSRFCLFTVLQGFSLQA